MWGLGLPDPRHGQIGKDQRGDGRGELEFPLRFVRQGCGTPAAVLRSRRKTYANFPTTTSTCRGDALFRPAMTPVASMTTHRFSWTGHTRVPENSPPMSFTS